MKSDVDQLASSVDAERAFSGGRLQVNHLQHDVSLQTFRAQMAVGSWYNTPLMNDLRTVTSIMRTKMEKGKGKASGKEGGNEVVKASYIVLFRCSAQTIHPHTAAHSPNFSPNLQKCACWHAALLLILFPCTYRYCKICLLTRG
jgi:hypothetical protein